MIFIKGNTLMNENICNLLPKRTLGVPGKMSGLNLQRSRHEALKYYCFTKIDEK